MRFLLTFLVIFFVILNNNFSQNKGLLLLEQDLPKVRKSLETEPFKTLYKGIYGSLNASISSDNSNSNARRANAGIAKNCAFILLMNKQNDCISDLIASDKAMLESKVIAALENLNTDPGTFANYNDWQWRAKDMQDYLTSYDFMRLAGVSEVKLNKSKSNLVKYAGNLYREATRSIFGLSFYTTIKNNHALMVSGALGIASIVLRDAKSNDAAENPAQWFNAALWNIDNLLWQDETRKLANKDSISGYAEGLHYIKYPMLNCLPFFRGIANLYGDTTFTVTFNNLKRKVQSPIYDNTYNNIWDWVLNSLMPNGKLPMLEDTFTDEGFAALAIYGNPKYNRYIQGGEQELSQDLQYNFDLRPEYICTNIEQTFPNNSDPTFQAMPFAGSLVYRSGWDSNAVYLHATAKHGIMRVSAGGHNQADETSFMLMKNNEMLALFPGYVKYDRRAEVANAQQRSMILVDNAGPTLGTPGDPGGADAYITDFCSLPNFDFGEMKTSYLETDIVRRIFFINKEEFIISDIATATKPHSYSWQLQGNGLENGDLNSTGIFKQDFANSRAVYNRKAASMLACVASNHEINFSTRKEKHEFRYDSVFYHTTTIANTHAQTKKQNTDYVCYLKPVSETNFNNDSLVNVYKNNEVNGVLAKSVIAFNNPNHSKEQVDKFFTTNLENTFLNDIITTDAETVLAINGIISGVTKPMPYLFFIANGRYLNLKNHKIDIVSDVKNNLALQKMAIVPERYVAYNCYVGAKSKVIFEFKNELENKVLSAIGRNVVSSRYDSSRLEVEFSGGGNFEIKLQVLGVEQDKSNLFSCNYNAANKSINIFCDEKVKLTNNLKRTKFVLYNLLGKEIITKHNLELNAPIPAENLASGAYLAEIILGNKIFRSKIFIN